MKSLTEYIGYILTEESIAKLGFVNIIELDDIGKYIVSLNPKLTNEDAEKIQIGFSSIFKEAQKDDVPCRALGSNTNKYIKIPYDLIPYLKKLPTESSDDLYVKYDKNNDKKLYIYYKTVKCAETGSGSYGKKSLNKEVHENLSAIYFNTPKNDWDILDAAIHELYSFTDTKTWCASFRAQALALLEKYGSGLRAIRIDNEKNIRKVYNDMNNACDCNISILPQDIKVLEYYNRFADIQKKFLLRVQNITRILREHYDKSDIILYDPRKLNSINKMIPQNIDEAGDVKSIMVKLFQDNILIGVSLKGLSSSKNEFKLIEYNTSDQPENGVVSDVIRYEMQNIGRFKQNKYLIQNGWTCDTEHKDGTKMQISFRSFGTSPALDVKIQGQPALGKSPIFLWRKFINEYSKKEPIGTATLRNISEIFNGKMYNQLASFFGWDTFVDDDQIFDFEKHNVSTIPGLQFLYSLTQLDQKEICENLTTWIRAACAESDYGFPFVLTKEY